MPTFEWVGIMTLALLALAVAGVAMYIVIAVTQKWITEGHHNEHRHSSRHREMSLVRLDPIPVLEMRAYSSPVNVLLPLSEMKEAFTVSALVTLAGNRAFISMAISRERITKKAYADLQQQLKKLGVTHIEWERHEESGNVRHVTARVR